MVSARNFTAVLSNLTFRVGLVGSHPLRQRMGRCQPLCETTQIKKEG